MENFPTVVVLLGIICVGLVISAVTRQRPEKQTAISGAQESESSSSSSGSSNDAETADNSLRPLHDHPWAFALLAITLLANAVLAYLVYDLNHKLDRSEGDIQTATAEARNQINQSLSEALDRLPNTRRLEQSLNEQEDINSQQQLQLEQQARALSSLTTFQTVSVDPRNIDIPFFCAGEIAVWGSGFPPGLNC